NGENQSRPRYIAVFSSGKEQASYHVCAEASGWVERELRGHFHYELARDLRQLEPAMAVIAQDGWRICQDVAIAGGMIEGNIKPEPVRRVQRQALQQILPELAFALVADSVLERAS
ncbi:MAG: hypothetical protein RJA86_725, partial [Pseudomonadota bacterium]